MVEHSHFFTVIDFLGFYFPWFCGTNSFWYCIIGSYNTLKFIVYWLKTIQMWLVDLKMVDKSWEYFLGNQSESWLCNFHLNVKFTDYYLPTMIPEILLSISDEFILYLHLSFKYEILSQRNDYRIIQYTKRRK